MRRAFRIRAILAIALLLPAFRAHPQGTGAYKALPSSGVFSTLRTGPPAGIVNENKVNVRTTPSLKGRILSQKNKGEIVRIYAEKGTKKVSGNVLDWWYKIDAKSERWMNALYIDRFPLHYRDKDVLNTSYLKNPADPGEHLKPFQTSSSPFSIDVLALFDRSARKHVFRGAEDYWYYVSVAMAQARSIHGDTWVHGSQVEIPAGAQNRTIDVTANPFEKVLDSARVDIVRSLGEPDRIQERPAENDHEFPSIAFTYPEFELVTIHSSGDELQILTLFWMKKPLDRSVLKYGLNVGIKEEYVQTCLGDPDLLKDGYRVYRNPGEFGGILAIGMENGVVSEILWQRNIQS